jgi:outer membrane usher protein
MAAQGALVGGLVRSAGEIAGRGQPRRTALPVLARDVLRRGLLVAALALASLALSVALAFGLHGTAQARASTDYDWTTVEKTAPPPQQYAKPVSTRLNPTGRNINMSVPLKLDGSDLGEIVVQIDTNDTVLVPKAALVDKMTPLLGQSDLEKLHSISESNGQVSLADLAQAGLNLRFDPGQLELVFEPQVDQRSTGKISVGRLQGPLSSANTVKPALFSAYLNIVAGAEYDWPTSDPLAGFGTSRGSGSLDLEGVVRFYNLVLENEMTFDQNVDSTDCAVSSVCSSQQSSGLKRRGTRLVYDIPDETMRIQAGDAEVLGTSLQSTPDILGVGIEKSPRKLRPGENTRPTGKSSFRMERPGDVEVIVNGAVVQRMRLRPGNYDLADLPLGTGANEIQLRITDDTGETRTLAFTTFFDGNLLAQGFSEWAILGGFPSYFDDNDRAYYYNQQFGTAFFRYGLTDTLTGEAHVQGDAQVVMGGLSLSMVTPFGFLGLQGAGSDAQDTGTGYAANVNYDLVNFSGALSQLTGEHESLRLGAEYRSPGFRTPGDFLPVVTAITPNQYGTVNTNAATPNLYPQNNYWLRLSASYSTPLWQDVSASISGRYQFASDLNEALLSPYTLLGNRYGADVTLSSPLTSYASGSLTFGYSNESYTITNTSSQGGPDLRVMARLFVRPDEDTRITVNGDSLNQDAYVSAYRTFGHGLGRWDTTIDVQQNGVGDTTNVGGSATYYGNRGEVRVAHNAGFTEVGWPGFTPANVEQRSSMRVGTSLLFADGRFGVGQPVRGNGFAIIYPHDSIADKAISVGTGEDVRAHSDVLGYAAVTDVPAYTRSTIPIDVADLPIGYSLGAGAFETNAPYRAGYALEVGSAASVSAYGTLLKADGEPVALLTGVAYPVDQPEKQIAIFTNSAGKFGAEGLSPGPWVIEMATEGAPTKFQFEVPKGTDGLFKAGTLTAGGGQVPSEQASGAQPPAASPLGSWLTGSPAGGQSQSPDAGPTQ